MLCRLFTLSFVLLASTSVWAQVIHPETEDTVNSNPPRVIPYHRGADTTGMVVIPATRPMPVPPPFSENYRPTPDATVEAEDPNTPQPGFPGARVTEITPIVTTPTLNLSDLFERGFTGKINGCRIVTSRSRRGCLYEVLVDGRNYPFHRPETCSSDASAAKVGCNYENQKQNAACILNQAMMVEYCR